MSGSTNTLPNKTPSPKAAPKSLFDLFRVYVFREWRDISTAAALSFVVTLLNLLSLGLFALVPNLLLNMGAGIGVSVSKGNAASSSSSTALSNVVEYISNIGSHLINYFGFTYAIILITTAYFLVSVAIRFTELKSTVVVYRARSRILGHLATDIFRHISTLSMEYFHRHKAGDIVTRIKADSAGFGSIAFSAVSGFFTALPLFLVFLGVLMGVSWQLTVLSIAVIALKILVTRYFGRYISRLMHHMARSDGSLGSRFTDYIINVSVVKAFGMDLEERRRSSKSIIHNVAIGQRRAILSFKEHTYNSIIQTFIVSSVVCIGLIIVSQGAISVEMLIIYIFTANRLQEPSRKITEFVGAIYQSVGKAKRVLEVFAEIPKVLDGTKTVSGFQQSIIFKNVSFSYGPNEQIRSLEGVDLEIKKNEVVAVTGQSGSGKTTLTNLLLRFYDPTEGQILLDGVDIRELEQRSYRRLFGVVLQDSLLFSDSIRRNIAYGAPDMLADEEGIRRAAKIAHVDEFAEHWPQKYDTRIGDRGVRLSGGQKQRIALARAVAINPEILVLDEATSALDSQSERLIQDAVGHFLKDKTAFVIAHRLSTVRNADRIIVLDKGLVVEQGTFDELIGRRGTFAALYRAQWDIETDNQD